MSNSKAPPSATGDLVIYLEWERKWSLRGKWSQYSKRSQTELVQVETCSLGVKRVPLPPRPAGTQGLWLSSGLSCLPSTPAALPSHQSCPAPDLLRWRGGQRASSLPAFLSPLDSGTTHSWPCFGPSHSLYLGTGRSRSSLTVLNSQLPPTYSATTTPQSCISATAVKGESEHMAAAAVS